MIACRSLVLGALLATGLGLSALPALAQTGEPSRPAQDQCAWEQVADAQIGLGAWVQKCDFGFRQIELFFDNGALAIQYSDGGQPDPVVEVMDMLPDETGEAALRRVFADHTDPAIAARCVLTPATLIAPPAGVERYTFVPDAAYQAGLDAKAVPDEVPEPACGDYGDWPDGIQYFELQPAANAQRLLFVRVGQEAPLFDEQTLQLLPAAPTDAATVGPSDCCGYVAGKAGVTADFLLETCSVPGQTAYGMIPNFDCQSYILAVVDTLRTLNEGSEASTCIPEDITAGQVLAKLDTDYDYERDGQRRAADVLLGALRKAYPCAA